MRYYLFLWINFISSAWSSGSHSIHLLSYSLLYIFQIFSSNLPNPISRGGINGSVCRSNSLGTLHSTHWLVHASFSFWRKLDLWGLRRMNWATTALYCTELHSTILYYTTLLLYIGVTGGAINISIRYSSEWVKFCCSYVFCHKMVTNGRILVFEVSIEPYWGLLSYANI